MKRGLSSMQRTMVRIVLAGGCLLGSTSAAYAQAGRSNAEWVTQGSDAQRSHSIPTDPKISRDGLQKPGFQFLWKTRLNNNAVQLNSLMPAILMDRYIGYRGFRSFAFVAGSSNTIYAIDSDLNRLEWQVKLPLPVAPAGSLECPGGLTSPIARATTANYPAPGTFGGLGGRSGPAHSAVGDAGEGAVTIAAALRAAAAAPGPPRPPGLRMAAVIYAVAGDGMLHSMYISNGVESEPPIEFLPPNSNAQGLVVIDNVAYATSQSCNGAPSGIWALDLASKQVTNWKPSSGSLSGSAGPAFGPDGTVYATTTSGELVALEPKTLTVRDTYTTGGQEFTSSAIVFEHKGRNLIAAATKDGRIQLLDSASLGGSDRQTPLFQTAAYAANFTPGALASWQSPDGVRWLLASASGAPASGSGFSAGNGVVTNGAVAAWKLIERNGAIALEPGWVSRDMVSPLPPMIVNGVVFAVSSGEYRSEDKKMTASQRAQRSSPAVLYAIDGDTGKALWDSGKTITSFVHSGGLSGGASQLYLATYDETFYAFGFPIEH
jgi:outer membrane protein assembly factor BamB